MGPCDIYQKAGTPCVSAYSTVRALTSSYNGHLFQAERISDSTTINVGVTAPGGYANMGPYNTFCVASICKLSILYDQVGPNNLTQATPLNQLQLAPIPTSIGGSNLVAATGFIHQWVRNRAATGTATGSMPQTEYMVAMGMPAVNPIFASASACCFDFGNMEATVADTGSGHMNALYYNDLVCSQCYNGVLPGPWAAVDMENGVFAGPVTAATGNTANPGETHFFMGVLSKCDCTAYFALKGGDVRRGTWNTYYPMGTPLPSGRAPMHQEGGLSLGEGGDGSSAGSGGFAEGVIINAVTTDAADNAVMANLKAFYYSKPTTYTNLPPTLGNLILWMDGADPSTMTFGTGNAIASWTDKSSNAFVFAQATGTKQPVLVPSILNDRSVTSFEGTQTLTVAETTDTVFNSAASIYMVVMPIAAANTQSILSQTEASGTAPCLTITAFGVGYGTCLTSSKVSTLHYSYYSPTIIEYISTGVVTAGATWNAVPYLNGVAGTLTGQVQAAYTPTGLQLGDFPGATSAEQYSGMIAEIVAVSGQDGTAARQKEEGYLACKWGIQSVLPPSHPYVQSCP
jgi:Alpha-L-arabinofuranosidase B, catalytic